MMPADPAYLFFMFVFVFWACLVDLIAFITTRVTPRRVNNSFYMTFVLVMATRIRASPEEG